MKPPSSSLLISEIITFKQMEYEINSFILRWRKYTDYYKCTILLYYTYIIILIVNKNTDIQLYSKKTNHQKGKTKMAIINLWWVNGNFWR